MIRSSYVIPRVALFTLFLGLSALAVNPLVRWGIVRTGQSVTGAPVEFDHMRAALIKGFVELDGIRAADPNRPMKNLFEADHVRLEIDKTALSRRRFVITHAKAIGFRLSTDRQTPGTVGIPSAAGYEAALAEQFADSGKQWLEQAAARLAADAERNLQSVDLAKQLLTRWPHEYETIETQTGAMQSQIERIQELIDESGDNPLRNLNTYQEAIAELEAIHSQTFEVRGSIDRLCQQLLMDKDSIDKARQHDEAYLTEKVQLEPLNTAQLSEYLMGPELGDRLVTVLEWLQWGRMQVPGSMSLPKAHRSRGKFVFFPGIESKPETVIRVLNLSGKGDFDDISVEFQGVVRGLSSDRKLGDGPVEIAMQTTSGPKMVVNATLDMRGKMRHDVININCPELPQPARVLGQADKLSINVSRANAHLSVRMKIDGRAIDGELIIKQQGVQLTPTLNPEFGGHQISGLVASSLDGVDRIEARCQIGGTLDEPLWKLDSNLGPALAEGITQAIDSHVNDYHQQLLAKTYAEVDSHLTRLEQAFETKQAEMLSQLEIGHSQIERINEIIASRVDLNDGVIDENSPLRERFLR
jgi:uncharacterized protein (TIGR03545 family)